MCTEKHSQIWARIFLKCPLWPLAEKLESAGTNFFYKKLNSNRLGEREYAKVWLWRCFATSHCFLPKIAYNILYFFWKGRGDGAWILTYLDTPITEVFFAKIFIFIWSFFRFQQSPGLQVMKTLGPSFSHLNLSSWKYLQAMFLLEYYLWWEFFTKLDHMWGSKGQKISQKGLFHGYCIGTQNFEKF